MDKYFVLDLTSFFFSLYKYFGSQNLIFTHPVIEIKVYQVNKK